MKKNIALFGVAVLSLISISVFHDMVFNSHKNLAQVGSLQTDRSGYNTKTLPIQSYNSSYATPTNQIIKSNPYTYQNQIHRLNPSQVNKLTPYTPGQNISTKSILAGCAHIAPDKVADCKKTIAGATLSLSGTTGVKLHGSGPQIVGVPTPKLLERARDFDNGEYGPGNVCRHSAERFRAYLEKLGYVTSFTVFGVYVKVTGADAEKSLSLLRRPGSFMLPNGSIMWKMAAHALTDVHLSTGTVWFDTTGDHPEISDQLDRDGDGIGGEIEPTDTETRQWIEDNHSELEEMRKKGIKYEFAGNWSEVFSSLAEASAIYIEATGGCIEE